jgi:hypothetical protein
MVAYRGNDGIIPCKMQPYHQQYLQFFRQVKSTVTAFYDSNKPTDKQKEGVVAWEQVLQKREELSKQSYGSREHLLLSMYTYIPPLRQDFNHIKIYTKTPRVDTGNYIVLNKKVKKLVMNDYKTSNIYGRFEKTLPEPLVEVIKASLNSLPREFLFTDVEGQPYTEANSFTVFSNRALKQAFNNNKISVSMLRHSFISSQDFNTLTEGEKKTLARDMGHSVAQQGQYRHIVDTDDGI